MSSILKNDYVGRVDLTDPNYPWGKGQNRLGSVPNTGTPFDEKWFNDFEGNKQAYLRLAGIVPSGDPDNAVDSDQLEAVKRITNAFLVGNPVGSFRYGFDFTSVNDIGIANDGKLYRCATTLPYTVDPDTSPLNDDFEEVAFVNPNLGRNPDWDNLYIPEDFVLQSITTDDKVELWIVESTQQTGGQLLANGLYANPTELELTAADKQFIEDSTASAIAAANRAESAATDILGSFSLEAASGGKNKIFIDAQGNPNVMVWIPKFNSEDVNQAIIDRHGVDLQLGTGVFPAFIKNGVQMRGFWYAKYIASAGENGGCSVISGVQPRTSVNYDAAKSLCTNKGAGWHLSANIEWLAVAYYGLAFGEQPRGDTYYGQAHDAKHEVATRASATHAPGDTGHSSSSCTGTGPATWSHDGTQFGVFDMVGNVWEWQDQLKLQEGQIFAPLDNNPDMAESAWPAHECYFDSSGATGGSVILNSLITNRTGDIGDNGSGNGNNSNTWRTMSKDPSYVENLLMRQMGIEPPPDAILNGSLYSRNFGERVPFRGGNWYSTSDAGLGALNFGNVRAFAFRGIGFRPALFES